MSLVMSLAFWRQWCGYLRDISTALGDITRDISTPLFYILFLEKLQVKKLLMGTYFQQETSTVGVRGPFLGSGPLKKDRSPPYLCSVQWRASGVPSLSKSGHLRFQGQIFYLKTFNYPLDIGRRRIRLIEFHPKW